ncbi:MAG: winged helix-turn-helix domain-containing protein [Candidatus Thorarchaeota archaeon]
MSKDRSSQSELETQLTGKTLRVYWWLLRNPGPHSARAVQRALGLSSPSLSVYHIEKLKSLGLVDTTMTGEHHAIKEVRVGVLEFFIGKGRFYLPRYVFYSMFYTIVLAMLPLILPFYPSPIFILCYAILLFGVITSWHETLRMWRQAPF